MINPFTKRTFKDGYSAIDTSAREDVDEASITFEVESVPSEEDEPEEPVLKEEDPVEEPKQEPVEPPKDDQKISRAEKRIRQLSADKKELLQKIEEYENSVRAYEEALSGKTKETLEATKIRLEEKYDILSSKMIASMEEGNPAETVKLQEQMMDIRMQLAGVTSEIQQQQKTKQEPPKKAPVNNIPEKAVEWIEQHPQFKTDNIFYASSLAVSQALVQEGFEDDSDEFYEELNKRLSPRFPEIFGVQPKKDVEYTHQQADQEEDQVVEQRVSGVSRSPGGGPKGGSQQTKRGKNTVLLTPEDVREANKLGLSLEQMARRMAHLDKSKASADKNGGYSEILIKKG